MKNDFDHQSFRDFEYIPGMDAWVYIMEIVTTLFRAKLTQGLADFWVAANAIKARTKIVI